MPINNLNCNIRPFMKIFSKYVYYTCITILSWNKSFS